MVRPTKEITEKSDIDLYVVKIMEKPSRQPPEYPSKKILKKKLGGEILGHPLHIWFASKEKEPSIWTLGEKIGKKVVR